MTVVMMLVIALAGTSVVHAEEKDMTITREEKIEYLKSIGTTDEAIENFNPIQIDNLYNTLYGENVKFSGFDTKIVEIKDENINARGNIPTSKLQLVVSTFDFFDGAVVSGVNVSLGFNWLQAPVLNLTDAFTFTWDSSLFYDDGFYATSGCATLAGYELIDSVTAPATAQAGGMGWYLSINNSIMSVTTSGHYGGAEILLRPRSTYYVSTNLDSKMYFTYAHQLLGVGISLGLPGSVGVSITGGNYDQQTYSYTYH